MGKSAIAVGVILILFGVWLIYKMLSSNTPIWVFIYPFLAIGIGIALIILHKEEDRIEERKDLNKRKKKR